MSINRFRLHIVVLQLAPRLCFPTFLMKLYPQTQFYPHPRQFTLIFIQNQLTFQNIFASKYILKRYMYKRLIWRERKQTNYNNTPMNSHQIQLECRLGRVSNIANPALETDYIALKENSLNGNLYLLVRFILSIHLDLSETGTCSYCFKFNTILITAKSTF